MAAGAQGKFFEFDTLVFEKQREIPSLLQAKAQEMGGGDIRAAEVQRAVFVDLAASMGLDAGKVQTELESGRWKEKVQGEADQAAKVGASGTPSSFINGRYVRGAQPFPVFKAEVEKEIAWAKNGNRPEFAKGTNVRQMLAQQQPAAARGPDPNQVYDLKAGDAPFEGPAGAKVTILHYLDYQ